jgi:hypothetical protein
MNDCATQQSSVDTLGQMLTDIIGQNSGNLYIIVLYLEVWMLLRISHQSDRQLVFMKFLIFVNSNVCVSV